MTGNELKVGAVEAHLLLGGLQDQDIGHIPVGNGIEVGFKLYEPIDAADPVSHFGAIIGVHGEGMESILFLLQEEFNDDPACGFMASAIALFFYPPPGHGPQVLKVLEFASIEEIPFDELEWFFHLSFRPGPPNGYRSAFIMGDEGNEGGIIDGASGLEAEHNGFLPIIETVAWNAAKKVESIPVTSDEGVEVTMESKINVLSAGESQDIGKAEDYGFAALQEWYGVGTPIHLPLNPRVCLKPKDRVFLWAVAHGPQSISQDGFTPFIAFDLQLFKEALTGDVWKFIQKGPDSRQIRIELACSRKRMCFVNLAMIPPGFVLAKDAAYGVSAKTEVP